MNPAVGVRGVDVVTVRAGESRVLCLRLSDATAGAKTPFGSEFDVVFETRHREADEFYGSVIPASLGGTAVRQSSRTPLATDQLSSILEAGAEWL